MASGPRKAIHAGEDVGAEDGEEVPRRRPARSTRGQQRYLDCAGSLLHVRGFGAMLVVGVLFSLLVVSPFRDEG